MSSIADEIIRTIQYAMDQRNIHCDRTYASVVKQVSGHGYVILDRTGCERTVPCCIPGMTLQKMQRVWVKEPMGRLADAHVCGVIEP